jgi:hypothetical protein
VTRIQEPGDRWQAAGSRWQAAESRRQMSGGGKRAAGVVKSCRLPPASCLLRLGCLLLAGAWLLFAANIKLYLKDGTFQLAREYKVEGDRVSFLSVDRGEWEEIPVSLVDLEKTQAAIKQHEEAAKDEAISIKEEAKALKEAAREIQRVPMEQGVYLVDDVKVTPVKVGESKIVTNKRRSVLKAISPLPMVTGKATVELDGPHSPTGTANREPEFYIRLSADERFGIIRLSEHKGNRVVEKLTILPVSKETIEEADLVDTFRKQVGDQVYRIWPVKPLNPGEYAVVEYTEGKVNMQVWDFFVAPGTGN